MAPDPVEFTVIVTAFRRAAYVGEALASLAAQRLDRSRFEVVLVSDLPDPAPGSVADPLPVRRLRKAPGGWGLWVAEALPACRGRWICFLDDDDRFRPEKLEALREAIAEDPGLGYFHHRVQPFRDGPDPTSGPGRSLAPYGPGPGRIRDREKEPGALARWFWAGAAFNESAVAVRREVIEALGPLFVELEVGHSVGVYLAAARGAWDLQLDDRVLGEYRLHDASHSLGYQEPLLPHWTRFRSSAPTWAAYARDAERLARFLERDAPPRVPPGTFRTAGTRFALLACVAAAGTRRRPLVGALASFLRATPWRMVASHRGLVGIAALALLDPRLPDRLFGR